MNYKQELSIRHGRATFYLYNDDNIIELVVEGFDSIMNHEHKDNMGPEQ